MGLGPTFSLPCDYMYVLLCRAESPRVRRGRIGSGIADGSEGATCADGGTFSKLAESALTLVPVKRCKQRGRDQCTYHEGGEAVWSLARRHCVLL